MENPELWKDHFPKTHHEAVGWVPLHTYCALHQFVICAATTRIEGAWSAYCMNVPGCNHRLEYPEVLKYGDKLPEKVALALFPQFEGVFYDG